jgi:hypothetical protein
VQQNGKLCGKEAVGLSPYAFCEDHFYATRLRFLEDLCNQRNFEDLHQSCVGSLIEHRLRGGVTDPYDDGWRPSHGSESRVVAAVAADTARLEQVPEFALRVCQIRAACIQKDYVWHVLCDVEEIQNASRAIYRTRRYEPVSLDDFVDLSHWKDLGKQRVATGGAGSFANQKGAVFVERESRTMLNGGKVLAGPPRVPEVRDPMKRHLDAAMAMVDHVERLNPGLIPLGQGPGVIREVAIDRHLSALREADRSNVRAPKRKDEDAWQKLYPPTKRAR